jgi:hypothetical protein
MYRYKYPVFISALGPYYNRWVVLSSCYLRISSRILQRGARKLPKARRYECDRRLRDAGAREVSLLAAAQGEQARSRSPKVASEPTYMGDRRKRPESGPILGHPSIATSPHPSADCKANPRVPLIAPGASPRPLINCGSWAESAATGERTLVCIRIGTSEPLPAPAQYGSPCC